MAIDQWVAAGGARSTATTSTTQTSSSVTGLNEFAQQQVDFGATEIGYSTKQAQYTPPAGYAYQYLPTVAGATCMDYNVDNPIGGQQITSLQLTTAQIMGIFTGTITTWGQLATGGLNGELAGDNSPIITVFRTDASGENYILSDYLNTIDPSALGQVHAPRSTSPAEPRPYGRFPRAAGAIPATTSPTGTARAAPTCAADYVYSNPGSITYVETAYAPAPPRPVRLGAEPARRRLRAPSALHDAEALLKATLEPDLEQLLTGVYTDTNPNAYPISAYSYLVTPEGQMNPAQGSRARPASSSSSPARDSSRPSNSDIRRCRPTWWRTTSRPSTGSTAPPAAADASTPRPATTRTCPCSTPPAPRPVAAAAAGGGTGGGGTTGVAWRRLVGVIGPTPAARSGFRWERIRIRDRWIYGFRRADDAGRHHSRSRAPRVGQRRPQPGLGLGRGHGSTVGGENAWPLRAERCSACSAERTQLGAMPRPVRRWFWWSFGFLLLVVGPTGRRMDETSRRRRQTEGGLMRRRPRTTAGDQASQRDVIEPNAVPAAFLMVSCQRSCRGRSLMAVTLHASAASSGEPRHDTAAPPAPTATPA